MWWFGSNSSKFAPWRLGIGVVTGDFYWFELWPSVLCSSSNRKQISNGCTSNLIQHHTTCCRDCVSQRLVNYVLINPSLFLENEEGWKYACLQHKGKLFLCLRTTPWRLGRGRIFQAVIGVCKRGSHAFSPPLIFAPPLSYLLFPLFLCIILFLPAGPFCMLNTHNTCHVWIVLHIMLYMTASSSLLGLFLICCFKAS